MLPGIIKRDPAENSEIIFKNEEKQQNKNFKVIKHDSQKFKSSDLQKPSDAADQDDAGKNDTKKKTKKKLMFSKPKKIANKKQLASPDMRQDN